jgi:NADPH:quinone reductase-like Zn-dependent oxidoreductase
MKAVVLTNYGSAGGLQVKEVEKPTPKDNEVLIRVRAATVTTGDYEMRRLMFPVWLAIPIRLYLGVIRPRSIILGQELAGEIEAVGKAVTRFRVGDQVFGTTGFGFGAHAEYKAMPAQSDNGVLAIKPSNLTFEEAAAIPVGGLEAYYFLKKADIQRGQRILIVGAGGSIGTCAVQLAKYFGAEVTGVDASEKLEMLRSIKADHVIDYTQEDFTQNGQTYDVIFDIIGRTAFVRSLSSLNEHGRYLLANPGLSQMIRGQFPLMNSKTVIFGPAKQTVEALTFLKGLIEAGALKSVIDRVYPLDQVAEAHRYVETGHKRGNVVITVS